MQELFTQRNFIIVAVFLILLTAGTHIWLTWYGNQEVPAPAGTTTNGGVQITDEPKIDISGNTTSYDGKKFTPDSLTVSIGKGLGCTVNVVNESGQGIRIGVSPHNPNGNDPGQNYAEINAGDNFLFDPRHSGYAELRFHDHGNPAAEFLVKFDKSCQ